MLIKLQHFITASTIVGVIGFILPSGFYTISVEKTIPWCIKSCRTL